MAITRRVWLAASVAAAAVALIAADAAAKDIGSDPSCDTCRTCANCVRPSRQEPSAAGTTISRTEGNLTERVEASLLSSAGSSMRLDFVYNSDNADSSRAQVDTVAGYGWTHSFNVLLFSQLGSMFRFDGNGRVTRYKLGAGGTYTAAPGYFETLVKNPDGSFTLRQKDGTVFTFMTIAGTPFFVVGPVHRSRESSIAMAIRRR
jgi:hypothetical protein